MTSDTPPRRILGAVIAGGQSRRFGQDKALIEIDGVRLIDQAISSLQPHVAGMVVCGRDYPDHICLTDRPHGGLGPLAGINAALHYARSHDFDAVLTTGCDLPDYPAEDLLSLEGNVAAVITGHWLIGHWPVALAGVLDRHLEAMATYSIRGWAEAIGARQIQPSRPIANLNTPQALADYLAAQRLPD